MTSYWMVKKPCVCVCECDQSAPCPAVGKCGAQGKTNQKQFPVFSFSGCNTFPHYHHVLVTESNQVAQVLAHCNEVNWGALHRTESSPDRWRPLKNLQKGNKQRWARHVEGHVLSVMPCPQTHTNIQIYCSVLKRKQTRFYAVFQLINQLCCHFDG